MKNQIRSEIRREAVHRTGVLVITSVVDLDALKEEHGDSVPIDAIQKAGRFKVSIEKTGKPAHTLGDFPEEDQAHAFVAGFVACADVRKIRNKPKKKKAANGSSSTEGTVAS